MVSGLPVAWAFFGKRVDQKVDEGADLGLCEASGRVDRVDALGLQREIGDCVLDQAFFHGVRIEEAGQVGDRQPR